MPTYPTAPTTITFADDEDTLRVVYDDERPGPEPHYAIYDTWVEAQARADYWNGSGDRIYFCVPARVLFDTEVVPATVTYTPKKKGRI